MKRIVFTTSVKIPEDRSFGNFFEYAMPHPIFKLDFHYPAVGLRFLKENIPDIEIMEGPSWEDYEAILKEGIDILGISFYTYQIPIVERMIEMARKYRVGEIWGGNYGILTPGIEEKFDRSFKGYAEGDVYETLYKRPFLDPIRHPVMIVKETTPLFPLVQGRMGLLFTHRGCRFRCKFCQTPVFAPQISALPYEEVEKAVREYHKRGVRVMLIIEEDFKPHQNKRLLELFSELGMVWMAQTRLDYYSGRVGEYVKTGFIGGLIGIEALSDHNLSFLNKYLTRKKIIETLKEMWEYKLFVQGTYMFGYENENEESIRETIEELINLPLLVCHYFVLTPLPQTELFTYIDKKYGIHKNDWSRFDCFHLVWNHPHITPERMDRLINYARQKNWSPQRYFQYLARIWEKIRFVVELKK